MKETFVISHLNEKELLRTLSLHGKVSFNTRILSPAEFAEEVMLRNGLIMEGEKADAFRQSCIIFNLTKQIAYFKDSNFNDCRNIVRELNAAGMLCRGDETTKIPEVFQGGEFKEKNRAIAKICSLYKTALKDAGLYDSADLINYVINHKLTVEGNFIAFEEDHLSPLEEELIKTVSKGHSQTETLISYAGYDHKPLNKCDYTNAYGSINETEHIFGYIAKNSIPYDDVLIVLNERTYINELDSFSKVYNVPLTFSMGYPLAQSDAAKIYELLVNWDKGFNALNPLLELVNAPEFNTELFWNNVSDPELEDKHRNKVLEAVGSLRISCTKDAALIRNFDSSSVKEPIRNTVDKIAEEFFKGYCYLIGTYTKIRTDNEAFDKKAISSISDTISQYLTYVPDGKPGDIAELILSQNIMSEASRPGYACVASLKDALSINRKHVFVTGLNAKTFPGSPKENYLLLDSDLRMFGEAEKYLPTSERLIAQNKELLLDVIEFANALGSKIHLSYAGYSLTDLKTENPSSMLFEIFRKERGENATLAELEATIGQQHSYFEETISQNRNIGLAFLKNQDLLPEKISDDQNTGYRYTGTISPSAAESFFECPKRFYLQYVLGIDQPEDDDPFNLLPGGSVGTLIHKCMEDYGSHPTWSEEEFIRNANAVFDDYLKQRKPIHPEGIESSREEYLQMALEGYRSDPHNEVYASEYWLSYDGHKSGLSFGGRTDRIEKLPNGNYLIVDYKTYKDIKNKDEDIDTCFQVVLYAYLLNKMKGFNVEGGEYRYLRNPNTFKITYNEETIKQLDDKIQEMKDAFDSGVFKCADSEDACRYCKFYEICGKKETEEKDEGDDE